MRTPDGVVVIVAGAGTAGSSWGRKAMHSQWTKRRDTPLQTRPQQRHHGRHLSTRSVVAAEGPWLLRQPLPEPQWHEESKTTTTTTTTMMMMMMMMMIMKKKKKKKKKKTTESLKHYWRKRHFYNCSWHHAENWE